MKQKRYINISFRKATFLLISALVFIALASVTILWIFSEVQFYRKDVAYMIKHAESKQKNELKQHVDQAIKFIEVETKIHSNESIEIIKKELLDFFEKIRFNYGGYIFVNTFEGQALLFNGTVVKGYKNIKNLTDKNGLPLFDMELELAKKPDGGYMEYQFNRVNTDIPEPKISFVKGYSPWHWIIGAGNYKNDITNELQKQEDNLIHGLYIKIAKILGLFLILCIINFLVANAGSKIFQKQFSVIDTVFYKCIGLPVNELKQEFSWLRFAEVDSYIHKMEYLSKLQNRAEKDIILAEKKFRFIFNKASDAIYLFKLNKENIPIISEINLSACKSHGYAKDELLGKPVTMLIAHSSQISIAENFKKLNKGEQLIFESEHLKKDKTTFLVEISASLINIGKEKYILAIERDITERKETEKRILESELHYRTIINQAGDAMFIFDLKGKIVDVNEAAIVSTGYSHDELVGMHVYDVDDKNEKSNSIQIWDNMILGKPITIRTYHKHKNNSTFPVEIRIVKTILSGKEVVIGFARDISDRIRIENAIKEKQNKLVKAQEVAKMGFLDWNMLTNKIFLSPKVIEMYGFEPEIDYVEPEFVTKVVHPDDLEIVQKSLELAIKGKKTYDIEHRIVKPNGDVIWVHAQAEMEYDEKGKPNNLLGTVVEITNFKKLEIELKEYQKNLEKVIKKRTEEVEKKNEKLIKSQQALSFLLEDVNEARKMLLQSNRQLKLAYKELEAFSYSVSHDLRAPLNRIEGFVKAIIDSYYNKLDKQGRHYLNRIRISNIEMTQLIDNMLTLSRISQHSVLLTKVNISQLSNEILYQLKGDSPTRQIEIRIQSNIEVECDKNLITILLTNLLSNAWKFTKNTKEAFIEVGNETKEDTSCFFVKDNGVGFDMKYYNQLFQPFRRLHSEKDFEGTGIGLAIVQRIINHHGWTISAKSEVNKETCFYVQYK
ncbi:MAG: PAS domain S-box protein [Chlorobi bacterium]|nr:PAS domain S-box protein [Chlorobiota bacterium]